MLVSEVINKPFGLIAELFETYIQDPAASPSEFDPSKHFAELFANPTERNQIPSINDVPIHQLPEKTLVRFRCMIQDTGLGQEIFITAYHNDDSNTGNKKIICHRFMDDPVDMKDGYPNEDHYLSERTAVYCVSPPDLNDAVGRLNIGEKSKAATVHQKYPLPGCDHVAAIIKFYDSQETVRVGQLVEVIGVVGQGFGAHDPTDEFNSHMESLSDIPVLHAITYRSLDPMPFAPECITDVLHQCRDIRPALIDYIASAFRGDKLVAEYVMLQLIARVSKNNGGMKIGQFALNINNFPSASVSAKNKDISLNFDNPASKHTASILESLVAHCVQCPLTLDVLNKMAFSPRSVNENLQAGLLQLVNGTTLLVDETVLTEGTLGDTGVRNVQALANVIQRQHLSYFFPYSHYDLDTDIGVLTLSSTKSILPRLKSARTIAQYAWSHVTNLKMQSHKI
ncbi:hypothetical protein DFQ30_009097 [Apophysomyces sp. BC1015]|nr:hypothetical protein DFQ30_009097 [Apophysomyces sp. BC1015]